MSNLAKIEFVALDILGKNYMPWMVDVEMYLESMDLLDTIKENNEFSKQDKAKAMIFIRRHLDEGLKMEYLTIKDPSLLWKNLQEIYDHQKEVILPAARDEWSALRFQDFKKVNEYNSAMFRIISQLKFCGQEVTDEDMLEKIFFTFHASNITLQQQYRVRGFKKYSELISCLLVAEKNNELLIKNHESRPTGATVFPEANIVVRNNYEKRNYHGPLRGCGRGRDRGHIHGRGRGRGRGRGIYSYNSFQRNMSHQNNKHHINNVHGSSSRILGDTCLRCGTKGHWAKACRAPKYLCQLYKASMKGKANEVNIIEDHPLGDSTHLDALDFDFIENCSDGFTHLNVLDFSNDFDDKDNGNMDVN